MSPTKPIRKPNGRPQAEPPRIRRFEANEGALATARRLFNAMESGAGPSKAGTTGQESTVTHLSRELHHTRG